MFIPSPVGPKELAIDDDQIVLDEPSGIMASLSSSAERQRRVEEARMGRVSSLFCFNRYLTTEKQLFTSYAY